MFKLIAELIERSRQWRYWRYMTKLMRESGPVAQHQQVGTTVKVAAFPFS
ncbi:hypothetical protein ACM8BJ_23715 [Pseudomonas aeruginosa]|nr:hypothetical protein [Pseudomonas aeruginosa]MDY1219099.1 hypothetical protein [Pseudomonas aeruginosa]